MTTTEEIPVIICIEKDKVQAQSLANTLNIYLEGFEIKIGTSADQGMRILDRLVLESRTIAMVISDHDLKDTKGDVFLHNSYKKWPHALRMLLADDENAIKPEVVEEAKIFRIFKKPLNEAEFRTSIREAARHFTQQMELTAKSRILTELHRASMSLTGEMNLEKLLHKLMRIVIDNADALHGYILLNNEQTNTYFIEAEGHSGSYETKLESFEVNDFSPVCPGIVDYVVQTQENVILDNAMEDGIFSAHPFIRKNACRSILCTPMIYQGKLYGVLYLENNEKTAAFSPLSLELFRLLSAPAAIAIQNAQLYQNLEVKVEERTREVVEQSKELERQRDKIEEKNKDIIDSLVYARRIQEAYLPKEKEINEVIGNSFIYYKPRDIVSGDFFWFSRKLSKVLLAAADCTGHGIPGAFMTIMANTLLRQIVELEGVFQPAEILKHLHYRVRIALQQDMDGSTNQDGLDIALIQLDVKRNKMQFAGARVPLIIMRNGEIEEIKGDKQGIGGTSNQSDEYTNHTVQLEKDDIFYIYSDGYPDQIGEEINKKFYRKRFFNLLKGIQDKDMEHQKILLDAELRHWRGEEEQTDDILVIGVKVGEGKTQ